MRGAATLALSNFPLPPDDYLFKLLIFISGRLSSECPPRRSARPRSGGICRGGSKVPLPTWRSFLHNHLTDIAAIDMFVVATATFRLLYALIVLGHDGRKIIHFAVTQNPRQGWLARQMTEAFPWDTAPRYLLRDRDASYGPAFRRRDRAMGIKKLSPRRGRLGRTHMSSASFARSAENVWITLIFLTRMTCARSCRDISNTITRPERISR